MASAFDAQRVSLPHIADISSYSLAELSQYDFISAHMTYAEAMAFPRSATFVTAMFRDPLARIISFYRYHRSHPSIFRHHSAVALAQDLSVEDFFADERIRSDARLDNRYLRVLADWPAEINQGTKDDHLSLALSRLEHLDAIGITERFDDTVVLFSALARLPCSIGSKRVNVTDDIHLTKSGFHSAEDVSVSPRLREIVEPLIRYDRIIYDRASRRFEQMLLKLTKADRRSRWVDHLKGGLKVIGCL